ncbi:hypothetical protein [Nocardia sp. NPDC050435]|uniref:hypothetical protein n=1 Tax=Nocardia sp. NPDC050435 TaxID=3155040 RepID=UPI0033CEA0A5
MGELVLVEVVVVELGELLVDCGLEELDAAAGWPAVLRSATPQPEITATTRTAPHTNFTALVYHSAYRSSIESFGPKLC